MENKSIILWNIFFLLFISCDNSERKINFKTKSEVLNKKEYLNSYKNIKSEQQFLESRGKFKLEKITYINHKSKPYQKFCIPKEDVYTFKDKEILNSKGEIVGYRKNRLEGYFTIKGLHQNREDFNLDTLATEYFTYRMDKERITMASYVRYINLKTKKSVFAYDITLYFKSMK
jgi:hypothetical protein